MLIRSNIKNLHYNDSFFKKNLPKSAIYDIIEIYILNRRFL